MKLPFWKPVVPPHVFAVLAEGVTYALVRPEVPRGFGPTRHFTYPPATVGVGGTGTPLFSREALSEAVESARRLAGGHLSRASVVFPDSWARMLPVDFETLPENEDEAREMVHWKLKKLLPGVTVELSVVYREMAPGPAGSERRLLVAAAPAETLHSIEESFESLGVRVGTLTPASLALLEGLAPVLSASARGDYALVHRSAGSFVFLVARDGSPVFFRQRPEEEAEEDHDQEIRLSLSYYAEKLQGPGLAAVYVHDALHNGDLAKLSSFLTPPVRLSARLLGADPDFDARVAARPELLPAFAAVAGRS